MVLFGVIGGEMTQLMKSNQSKNVSILPERLDKLIRTGKGKAFSFGEKSKRKWTLAELQEKTGIHYQTISKIRRGSEKSRGQNGSTIETLAAAFDVDPGYLTGEQDVFRIPKKESSGASGASRSISDTVSFVARYGIRIVLDSPEDPKKYSVFDADNRMIEKDRDIEGLLPLVGMMQKLFSTGHDIVSLYFDGAWMYEE